MTRSRASHASAEPILSLVLAYFCSRAFIRFAGLRGIVERRATPKLRLLSTVR